MRTAFCRQWRCAQCRWPPWSFKRLMENHVHVWVFTDLFICLVLLPTPGLFFFRGPAARVERAGRVGMTWCALPRTPRPIRPKCWPCPSSASGTTSSAVSCWRARTSTPASRISGQSLCLPHLLSGQQRSGGLQSYFFFSFLIQHQRWAVLWL